ncbi:hypothetical protein PAXINDRAFT_153337 [Paxillus involutus ATCC 200175]|nr:hypothetical protein PAXINDRAFT_153337 [Paxillus involutus ATCC 200175]
MQLLTPTIQYLTYITHTTLAHSADTFALYTPSQQPQSGPVLVVPVIVPLLGEELLVLPLDVVGPLNFIALDMVKLFSPCISMMVPPCMSSDENLMEISCTPIVGIILPDDGVETEGFGNCPNTVVHITKGKVKFALRKPEG